MYGPQYLEHNNTYNSIGGIMVSVLSSSSVDRRMEPRLGQTKNNKIDSLLSMQH
jgi:hypothetical protein